MLTTDELPRPRAIVDTDRFDAVVRLPIGCVGVRTHGAYVQEISFLPEGAHGKAAATELGKRAVEALVAYCADASVPIALPLAIEGTDFQRRVWNEICAIAPGATRSYGEIARRLGSVARAVGQACGDNRLPLAIPCHRVVAASGIGGFAHRRGGAYERIKRWLLLHEAGCVLRLT
ncbi:MAG: methylated-DNA--[protein]-cysteine S-methyltransferase [Burkholderiaceae bacterium]